MLIAADPDRAATSPMKWPWALEAPAIASSEQCAWQTGLLRRWAGTSHVMVQPPLDHHYVVMHLGGAKHVTRRRDGPQIAKVVEEQSLTFVPAGSAYVWDTRGPIAFAHLYLKPAQLAAYATRNLGLNGDVIALIDKVGCRDAFLEPLFMAMIDEIQDSPGASTLRLDTLLEAFCCQLAHRHTARRPTFDLQVIALAAHRLRRVLEFIEANLASDLSLADLAAAAGTGQAHFSRAFQMATGCSPYRYLVRRRIEYAKVLLLTRHATIESISGACGYQRPAQFATMFKSVMGVGPKRYVIEHRTRARRR